MAAHFCVLLVEDDPGNVARVRAALQPRDVLVHDVPLLSEALQLTATALFDLILMELTLPDASGVEALVTLRRQAERTAMVILTAVESDEIAAEALRCGAEDYLLKQEITARSLWRAVRQANLRHHLRELDKDLLRARFQSTPDTVPAWE